MTSRETYGGCLTSESHLIYHKLLKTMQEAKGERCGGGENILGRRNRNFCLCSLDFSLCAPQVFSWSHQRWIGRCVTVLENLGFVLIKQKLENICFGQVKLKQHYKVKTALKQLETLWKETLKQRFPPAEGFTVWWNVSRTSGVALQHMLWLLEIWTEHTMWEKAWPKVKVSEFYTLVYFPLKSQTFWTKQTKLIAQYLLFEQHYQQKLPWHYLCQWVHQLTATWFAII